MIRGENFVHLILIKNMVFLVAPFPSHGLVLKYINLVFDDKFEFCPEDFLIVELNLPNVALMPLHPYASLSIHLVWIPLTKYWLITNNPYLFTIMGLVLNHDDEFLEVK